MMRFCSLGSGSGGNATVVEARNGTTTSRVLVDCGFTMKELMLRLARSGLVPQDLHGVFITHEHGDHVGCALTLARKFKVPVWMSRGTWRAIGEPDCGDAIRFARDGQQIAVGDLLLSPYTVPHDANEPLQLAFTDGSRRLGVLTDTGSVTAHLLAHLQRCDALLLECNHDRDMLAGSRYPKSLRSRISGPYGHLANDTASEILAACLHGGLKHLVAAHLSRENNSPELAMQALARGCGGSPCDIVVADQALGFEWLALD
ncbi:MAG: fold metallo-hydrolase [Rhizobacter sp.]|nr:fold metallo-hydrolase [Rhizobacter sp.]